MKTINRQIKKGLKRGKLECRKIANNVWCVNGKQLEFVVRAFNSRIDGKPCTCYEVRLWEDYNIQPITVMIGGRAKELFNYLYENYK